MKPKSINHLLPLLAGTIIFPATATAELFEWGGTSGGDWSLTTAAGWVSPGTYPNAADDFARVFKNIGAPQTITINVTDAKVGTLFLQDNQSNANAHWDIATSNPVTNFLTFETTSGSALLDIDEKNGGGAVTISAPIKLNSDLEINVKPTVGALISGVIADGTASHNIIKTGGQLLTLSGVNTYTGTTTINAGTLRVFADSGLGTVPAGPVADSIILNGGTLDTRGPGNFEIASNRGITLGSDGGTWATTTPPGTHVATYNGVVTGPGSFTKAFAQVLVLGGENTYLGSTTLTAGTLRIASESALGDPASGPLFLNSGTFQTTASVTIDDVNRTISLGGGNVTLSPNAATTLTIANPIDGAATLTKAGSGDLILLTANTFTGTTSASAGNIILKHSEALGGSTVAVGDSQLVFDSSVVSNAFTFGGLSGANDLALQNNDVSPAAVDITVGGNGVDTTYTGILSGDGALTKVGAGALTLTALNTFTGNTTISGGLIEFSSLDNFGTGTVTLDGGGVRWAAATTTDISSRLNPVLGSSGGTFDTNGNDITYSSVLSGTGSFIKAGAGTLVLTEDNSYLGDTFITGGILSIASPDRLGEGDLVLAGGTLQTTGSITLPATALESGGGILAPGAGTTLTIDSPIGGTGGLTLAGEGDLCLEAANTFTGPTTVTGTGKIILKHTDALAGSTVSVGSAGLEFDSSVITNTFNFGGLSGAEPLTLENNDLTPQPIILGVGGNNTNTTHTGPLGGAGSIVKTGTGRLSLEGVNLHTGKTTISEGTLQIIADSGFGSVPPSPVPDALTINGGTLVTRLVGGAFEINSNRGIVLGPNGATWETTTPSGAWTVTHNGIISGPGSLTKTFGQGLHLGGDNTFTGGFTITGGTVRIGHPGALNATTPNTVTITGGSLHLNGNSITIASLNGSGGFVRNANATPSTLTIDSTTDDTFPGPIEDGTGAGTLSLVKDGTGSLHLPGTNTYTGTTLVSGGKLLLSGSLTSDVTVATGASFAAGTNGSGSGTVAALTLDSGSTLELEIDSSVVSEVAQVETSTALGTASADGDLLVTVTGDGIAGSPLALFVPILAGDTPKDWATKVRSALSGEPAITALYIVGGSAAEITLTRNSAGPGDPTLNISITNDFVDTGITETPSSADTVPGGNSNTPSAGRTIATGVVNISGATLSVSDISSVALPDGTKITVLDYSASGSLTGTFDGLTNGDTLTVGPNLFTIDYNDNATPGTITLTAGLVAADPFAEWAQTNISAMDAVAPAGFADDADSDGLANGLEWILGGSPLDGDLAGILPSATADATTGLTIVFNREPDSINETNLTVEWDTNLDGAFANSILIGTSNIGPSGDEPTVTLDNPVVGKVTVNIPAANSGGSGRIFARLTASPN